MINNAFTLVPYKHIHPTIAADVFLAQGACIVGDVTIGALSTIWFNCVIRGDVEPVTIGERTNIQDGTVIHVTRNGWPTRIGSEVTIGHRALLHACTIHDRAFIGMGAIILDGAVVESEGMLAAGALLTSGKTVRTGELWAGSPAKFMRLLTEEERRHTRVSADNYVLHGKEYRGQ
jgi:carbonic anhydrase/acetyltransferase-like protein (isoleucine patch superfamily)